MSQIAPTELLRHVMPSCCDAVEFCKDRKRFLVATYELSEGSGDHRDGSLTLFNSSEHSFAQVSQVKTSSGVLDVKFLPSVDDHFVIPLAHGGVQLGHVTSTDSIELQTSSKEDFSSDVALSVSCHSNNLISTAYSSGTLRQFEITETEIKLIRENKIHEFEAWAVLALDKLVLSGSDDCTLRSFDDNGSRVLRKFDAGVTAIERDVDEFGIIVGTYEEKIYKFDRRFMKKVLLEAQLTGGVWRIKDSPYDTRYIAVAGMYTGALILNRETFEVLSHYQGHSSMCYGIAWLDQKRIISCSFYDKLVSLWETGIKN